MSGWSIQYMASYECASFYTILLIVLDTILQKGSGLTKAVEALVSVSAFSLPAAITSPEIALLCSSCLAHCSSFGLPI